MLLLLQDQDPVGFLKSTLTRYAQPQSSRLHEVNSISFTKAQCNSTIHVVLQRPMVKPQAQGSRRRFDDNKNRTSGYIRLDNHPIRHGGVYR